VCGVHTTQQIVNTQKGKPLSGHDASERERSVTRFLLLGFLLLCLLLVQERSQSLCAVGDLGHLGAQSLLQRPFRLCAHKTQTFILKIKYDQKKIGDILHQIYINVYFLNK
jgi:hypothetical protein